jgi:hypothetical protein
MAHESPLARRSFGRPHHHSDSPNHCPSPPHPPPPLPTSTLPTRRSATTANPSHSHTHSPSHPASPSAPPPAHRTYTHKRTTQQAIGIALHLISQPRLVSFDRSALPPSQQPISYTNSNTPPPTDHPPPRWRRTTTTFPSRSTSRRGGTTASMCCCSSSACSCPRLVSWLLGPLTEAVAVRFGIGRDFFINVSAGGRGRGVGVGGETVLASVLAVIVLVLCGGCARVSDCLRPCRPLSLPRRCAPRAISPSQLRCSALALLARDHSLAPAELDARRPR